MLFNSTVTLSFVHSGSIGEAIISTTSERTLLKVSPPANRFLFNPATLPTVPFLESIFNLFVNSPMFVPESIFTSLPLLIVASFPLKACTPSILGELLFALPIWPNVNTPLLFIIVPEVFLKIESVLGSEFETSSKSITVKVPLFVIAFVTSLNINTWPSKAIVIFTPDGIVTASVISEMSSQRIIVPVGFDKADTAFMACWSVS